MTSIIAEVGVNHNGDLSMAIDLIAAASDAGADIVKFQSFRAKDIVTKDVGKVPYQKASRDGEDTQYGMLSQYELSEEDHHLLMEEARKKGLEFLSTPFCLAEVALLDRMGVSRFKVSSGDLNNAPLLYEIASTGRATILSTGMGSLEEVERALRVLAFGYACRDAPSFEAMMTKHSPEEIEAILQDKVVVLHCTTQYPAPLDSINLRAMESLRDAFALPVGYSDHSEGSLVSVAAVALGAVVIEKHITLDSKLPGPDHKASMEPAEFARMVRSIREVETVLGASKKEPTESEKSIMGIVRKSLVASRTIKKGELFTKDNLALKRCASSLALSPENYWALLDRSASRDYSPDDAIVEDVDELG